MEMYIIEVIGMYKKKMFLEVVKELLIIVGIFIVVINNLVKKGYVECLCSEDDWCVVKFGLIKKGKLFFRVY